MLTAGPCLGIMHLSVQSACEFGITPSHTDKNMRGTFRHTKQPDLLECELEFV